MKSGRCKLMVLMVGTLAAVLLGSVQLAAAGSFSWEGGERRNGSNRHSSGVWRGDTVDGYSYPASSAQISQALYGTPPEPYDVPADNKTPEAVQAG